MINSVHKTTEIRARSPYEKEMECVFMDAQGTVRRLELKNLHRREGGEEEFGEVKKGEL